MSVISVEANDENVLSAFVDVATETADSVQVRYRIDGNAVDSVAPFTTASDTLRLPVYGLLPGRTYSLRVRALGPGGSTTSESIAFTTGALPGDLPSYTTSGATSTPGYVVFGAGSYGIVIDHTGRVVWYKRFLPAGPGLNFIAQSNGHYAAQPPTLDGNSPRWTEVEPTGHVTRTFSCANGLRARMHDLVREADDSYWLICDDVRTMDLSAIGGIASARVTAVEIQHIGADGQLRFRWNAFEHLDIADLESADRSGAVVNWTHANALELHPSGLVLVSLRNLSQIVAVNRQSGTVAWKLGGVGDEFALAACCSPTFARQHGLRVSPAGHVVLLDNLGKENDSRVQTYALDMTARTATLLRSHSAHPAVVASLGGSVQLQPNGNILAAFGDGRQVEELDANGNVIWRIDGDPGYIFRAQRITSLYKPGVGTAR